MRILTYVGLLAFFADSAFSQSASSPVFEAADVHVSAHVTNRFPEMKGPFNRGGRYELRTATMVDLIATAYGVDADKVVGGPNWLEMDRFDVLAKPPSGATREMKKLMLQALLADRFKLAVHNDTRPMPAWALTAGKHPALKKADGSGEAGCKFIPPKLPAPESGPVTLVFSYSCRGITMQAFAEGMPDMAGAFQFIGENRVADRTGLEGAWDFDFKYSPRNMRGAAAGDTITFLDAIEKQLGFKLEPAQVPMPVIVVDRVNRTPTDNLPGVTEKLKLSPIPTEFDVADVQPTSPDYKGVRFQIQPGGRVNLQGVTLKTLIEQAWDVTDDMLAGAPKWLDTERFDIVAKASAAVSASERPSDPDIDTDSIWLMLRALLANRFKLATHYEDRPVAAYTLIAAKPKLKKADPSSRTRFKQGPATPDAKDPRKTNPLLSRLVTVQNMTMGQFAEKLQSIAPGYIHTPVLDATGLEGAFDFTLSFSPIGIAQGGRGGRGGDSPQPASATPEASDPGGALSLPEAIEKQLGLKLELQKRPVSVLVIDHVEQKPIEN